MTEPVLARGGGGDRAGGRAAGADRGNRALGAAMTAFHFLSAALFMTFYTGRTRWIPPGMEGFTNGQAPYPFRYRVLAPLLARASATLTHLPLALVYAALGTLAVFGLLLVFERLLAEFARRDLARVLAPAILYPVAWNYCGLNLMYFPFDMPGLFFMVAACLCLVRRSWPLYYALFVLGTLNRETTWFWTVLFLLVEFRRLPFRALTAHLAAQAAIWVGLKIALYDLFPGSERALFATMLPKNLDTWHGMLTLHGTGLKDWAKAVLMFGGLWLAVPFVLRGQPRFVQRTLWGVVPFVAAMIIVGTIDEARVYGEILPLVTLPVLIWLARRIEAGAPPLLTAEAP